MLNPRGGLRPPTPLTQARAATMTATWTRPPRRRRTSRWSGGGDAARARRPRRPRARRSTSSSREGAHHDLVLVLVRREPHRAAAGRRRAPGGRPRTPGASACPSSSDTIAPRDARHAYAVLRGLTSAGGGDGRRRDHVAARTGPAGPQLRLPLRLDPRPVLRRAGRRRAPAPHPLHGRRRALRRATACSPTGPHLAPAYTVTGGAVPDERHSTCPATPAAPTSSATGSTSSSSSTRSARRCCCSPPPPTTTTSTPTAGAPPRSPPTRSSSAGTSPTPASGSSTPTHWTHSRLICAAGLRAIAVAARAASRPPRWLALADAIVADTAAPRAAPVRALAALARRPARRRRAAAAGDPRRDPRRRPALARDPARRRRASSPRTATATATGPTSGRSASPKARSCCAASGWRSPTHQQGDTVAAARWFERNRAACGPPGLLLRGVRRHPAPDCAATCRRRSSTRCCSSAPPP